MYNVDCCWDIDAAPQTTNILLQAMFVSFGMAAESGGDCYLRFDDTNPEAEKLEYIEHIQDIVSWMGWQPYKVGLLVRLLKHALAPLRWSQPSMAWSSQLA